MKNNNAAKETAKSQPQTAAPAMTQNGKAKSAAPTEAPAGKAKAKKEPAVKVEKDEEPADRLPTTVAELKESKSGLVTFLHLSGKEKDEIAKEVAATFKVADTQAVKIVRRITGRARFFRRAFDLTAAK